MRSSYHVNFHNYGSYIDADLFTFITQLSHDEYVCQLSQDPFVEMPLNTSPAISPRSHRRNKANQINSNNVHALSMALQHQMSLSNMSVPSLMADDHHDPLSSWSTSEISLIKTLVNDEPLITTLSATKPLPKIPTHEDFPGNIWSEPSPPRSPPLIPRSPPIIPTRDSSLSLTRNYGSANLATLSSTPPRFLLPPTPVSLRVLQRPQTANANPTPAPKTKLKLKRQASYLAFPPQSTSQHKSWSTPQAQSEQVLLRPRANTTPVNYTSSHHPSNLSSCTTLSPIPSPSLSTSPLQTYPRAPSPTNHIHIHPTLMEFISQQSYFFHEDDEDCSLEKNWFETQRRRWLKLGLPRTFELVEEEEERRSGSSDRVTPSQAYYAPRERRGAGSMRKKSTAALRDFFTGKK